MGVGSAEYWTVVDGALTPAEGKSRSAGQSKEDYGDGEIRYRFSVQGVSQAYLAVRQGSGGAVRAVFRHPAAEGLGNGEHELIFACKGTEVTARLDGKSVSLVNDGQVNLKGRLQFSSPDGVFRISGVDYRPLR